MEMVDMDSDNESECFESAEESLDEEENAERMTRLKNNLTENKSEIATHVSLNSKVDETVLVGDNSVSLVSYRKRPERVKRSPSVPSPKVNSKSKKFNDTIFKADVADVFFQDITSKMSKNINKSLYTLQQTSSNVKDLIFSTLPASSVHEEKAFLYDDSLNFVPISGDNEILSSEALVNKIVSKSGSSSELPKCESENNEGIGNISGCQNNENIVDIFQMKGLKIFSENNLTDRNCAQILESEARDLSNTKIDQNNTEINNLEPGLLTEIIFNKKLQTFENAEKESLDDLNKYSSENLTFEALKLNNKKSFDVEENKVNLCQSLNINEFVSEELKSNEKSNLSNETVLLSTASETENTNAVGSLQSQNYKEYFTGLDIANEEPENVCLTKNGDIKKEDNEKKVDVKNKEIDKNKGKVDLNELQEEKSLNYLKVNAAELRTDKEYNIKQNYVNQKNLNETPKTDFNKKENSDGWDDFDFSDTEIEDVNAENTNKCDKLNKPEVKDEKESKQILKEEFDSVNKKAETQKVSKLLPNKKHLKQENVIDGREVSKKEDFDESWNWETWDDELISTEEEKEELINNATVKNYENDENVPEGGNKWSGWDNFSQKIEEKQGNWNIGNWGVSLLLNKATAVTQGISNVLETGLGVPDPETFAKMQVEEERQLKSDSDKTENKEEPQETSKKNSLTGVNLFPVSGITNLVAGVTSKIVEHTKIQELGSKVLTGSLDTLETFGKKTMEVLQEGDPGLRNKRALLMGNNKPVLSQILKEASEKAEREIKQAEEKALAKKCHFEALFDDFQGMVHLEALEMLSRQYELKLKQLKNGMSSEEIEDLEGVLEEVEQLCVLDDLDVNSSVLDFKTSLQLATESLKKEISVEKIIQIHDNVNKWLQTSSELDLSSMMLHQKVVSTVAELTAATVQQFLKAGQLLSLKECRKTVDEIDALAKLTNILCLEINKLCEKFILMVQNKSKKESDSSNTVTEKIIAMRNNSTSYIKQAFNLLIPILQAGAAF